MTLPATDPVAESMYAERRRGLFVLALGLTGSPVIAEDVVHDVFEAVLRGRRLPHEPAAAAAYLRTSVVNRCRSVHRRAAVRRRYESTLPRREQLVLSGPDAEEHAEVYAAVQQLSRRQREVIVLRYWADLSDDDIAAALHCSTGNVRALAFRARARLAEILEVDR